MRTSGLQLAISRTPIEGYMTGNYRIELGRSVIIYEREDVKHGAELPAPSVAFIMRHAQRR